MPRNTANPPARDTPRIRIRRIDAVHRAMQTSTATKRRRNRTSRLRVRAVSVNPNSSRFSETSSVSSSGYDADRDFDAQSVASSSQFSQRALSELGSHAMTNGPFLRYFPGQSDATAAVQYWDAFGLDSSGNEAAEMDADLDSSSSSSSSSSFPESIPPLSLNPPSRRRRPLQPTLSTTIQSSPGPFLRAAKASGVVSNTNTEVDLAGGSVRLRVRDCHWVEAGEVRDMKMRWSRWSRKGKEMDVVNEEE
uniref:Uncharacterized protein n=1 Tax=Mycena chlorophos TaxID=658473 RepID=A0ABQ0LII2_MYCCL|nr:predicted protein [Mycena chlorophos]